MLALTLLSAWVVSPEMGTLSIELDADPYRGRKVRVEGWIDTPEGDWTSVWVRVDGMKTDANFDNAVERDLRPDGWVRHSVVLDVPHSAETLSFGVLLSGIGPTRIDDLKVVDLGGARGSRGGRARARRAARRER